jgi:hypothetical protein
VLKRVCRVGEKTRLLTPTHTPLLTLPHITHLTAKPSRMIGVQVGVWCVSVSRARTSTRGNTLLPSTLTLLIGLRVTHSWGCVYVYVCV